MSPRPSVHAIRLAGFASERVCGLERVKTIGRSDMSSHFPNDSFREGARNRRCADQDGGPDPMYHLSQTNALAVAIAPPTSAFGHRTSIRSLMLAKLSRHFGGEQAMFVHAPQVRHCLLA